MLHKIRSFLLNEDIHYAALATVHVIIHFIAPSVKTVLLKLFVAFFYCKLLKNMAASINHLLINGPLVSRISQLVREVLSPLVLVLLGVQCPTGSPWSSIQCSCLCCWGWQWQGWLWGTLFSTGGCGAGRRAAVSPRGVLPAAVWGMAGCDLTGFLFYWFVRVRSGRAESSSGGRASCSLSIPAPPSITCSQAELTLPAALLLFAFLSCC